MTKLDADIIELLAQNLSRLNEENVADRAGVYQILSTFSNQRVYITLF